MCDYSLAHFPNRLAVEGEQLIVHRFDTLSIGLAPADPAENQSILLLSGSLCPTGSTPSFARHSGRFTAAPKRG
jgi:hypothetical protein